MTDTDALRDLTRPIIGIENRTAQEAFDIMADRIRAALATLSKPEPAAVGEKVERAYAFAVGRLCNLLARFEEIKDWVENDIGTAWNCERCGYSTYHANATECADCGEDMPFAHVVAFKLGARATDNREAIELMADELAMDGLALEFALANPQQHPAPSLPAPSSPSEAISPPDERAVVEALDMLAKRGRFPSGGDVPFEVARDLIVAALQSTGVSK